MTVIGKKKEYVDNTLTKFEPFIINVLRNRWQKFTMAVDNKNDDTFMESNLVKR